MITRPLTRSRSGQPELLRVKRTNVGEESRPAFGFSSIAAYSDTSCASNRPAEAINGVSETTRKIACGFRNFDYMRWRGGQSESGDAVVVLK